MSSSTHSSSASPAGSRRTRARTPATSSRPSRLERRPSRSRRSRAPGRSSTGREGDALEAAKIQEPAGALDGEGGLPLTSLAEHGEAALVAQPALDLQDLAGTAHEAMIGRIRKLSLTH